MQPPFSFLTDAAQKLLGVLPKQVFPSPDQLPRPPVWAVQEAQRRIVLLLNHVLMQEPEAMTRLARQQGRSVLFQWRDLTFGLRCTPAGLFDLLATDATEPADLTLTVTEESPLAVAQTVLAGEKPAVRIEGHVALASELNWLAENVRWDVEEDLARLMGDAPAHGLVQAARRAAEGLRGWLSARKPFATPPGSSAGASPGSGANA